MKQVVVHLCAVLGFEVFYPERLLKHPCRLPYRYAWIGQHDATHKCEHHLINRMFAEDHVEGQQVRLLSRHQVFFFFVVVFFGVAGFLTIGSLGGSAAGAGGAVVGAMGPNFSTCTFRTAAS